MLKEIGKIALVALVVAIVYDKLISGYLKPKAA